ncbi:MAG TPA: hypothetical protein VFC51_12600 [Chloroflexota bacterium]|nr:hypothetical protein [Chloroflexota bacterium]
MRSLVDVVLGAGIGAALTGLITLGALAASGLLRPGLAGIYTGVVLGGFFVAAGCFVVREGRS